jgi:hypothetical protein
MNLCINIGIKEKKNIKNLVQKIITNKNTNNKKIIECVKKN